MKYCLIIMISLMCTGCASRQAIGKIEISINLEKQNYKELLNANGTSSSELMAYIGVMFSQNGAIPQGGVGIRLPLTNEIEIIGLNKINLNEIAFFQEVKWGNNKYEADVYCDDIIVVIRGDGPLGNIYQFVGEIKYGENAKSYDVIIKLNDISKNP